MAPQIPDRWLKYRPIGERVEGTRFIAFKVPLREHINKLVNESDRLHGKLLLEKVPNLGVIIDLTNTNRYYDPNFFKNEGVEHKKLMIPGHLTPAPRLVNRFKEFVKQFIQNNLDNDKLIGVHCTHGVNRTGYLICNYMVSEMEVDPPEAIKKFAEARGHSIERQNYLDSLRTLNSDKDDGNNAPEKRNQPRAAHSIQNWRTERTDRVEHNWRIQRDQSSDRNTHRCITNWRSDNRDRSNTRNPDGERYNWRRDNTVSPGTRNSDSAQKRTYVDNNRDQSDQSGTDYNIHNSYSDHKQERQFRDSNNSQHANYNNNQYCPSNSNYSRSSRPNSTTSNTDNTTKLRLRTDYYNEPRTSSKRGRISHYSQHQQQTQ